MICVRLCHQRSLLHSLLFFFFFSFFVVVFLDVGTTDNDCTLNGFILSKIIKASECPLPSCTVYLCRLHSWHLYVSYFLKRVLRFQEYFTLWRKLILFQLIYSFLNVIFYFYFLFILRKKKAKSLLVSYFLASSPLIISLDLLRNAKHKLFIM